jgi:hypothetical protein
MMTTKRIAKYVGVVLLGALGFVAMRGGEYVWTLYRQHVELWTWAQDTDRMLHPQKYALPPPPAPQPTPTVKK